MNQIDQAVQERLAERGTNAAREVDEARTHLRAAAKYLYESGLPSELHKRVCLLMDECHAAEAVIGEHMAVGND